MANSLGGRPGRGALPVSLQPAPAAIDVRALNPGRGRHRVPRPPSRSVPHNPRMSMAPVHPLTIMPVVAANLIGSLSGRLLLGRLYGVDIRTQGSGNAGGTESRFARARRLHRERRG